VAPPSPFRRSVTGRVSVVAHRGVSAVAPENTMAAFRLAAEVGCDLLEFDVHLTKDDQLVVIHDDTLDRTTNGTGYVRDHTLAEIRGLDASYGDHAYASERVPSLDEVMAWARGAGITLSLEIKQPAPVSGRPKYPRVAERVADMLTAHGMAERALVHSFDHPTVRELRDLLPTLPTAVNYGGGTFTDPLLLGTAADASGIGGWWAWVSPAVCAAAHTRQMHAHAWGMADPPDPDAVALLVRAGVDSLDARDPRLLRPILAALG
jgi:glycerophosphoryl diester phosphodiesterase